MERPGYEFDFVTSKRPHPTVKIDLDSAEDVGQTAFDIAAAGLSRFAAENPEVVASAYSYFTPSVNFGVPTGSEFFMVVGAEKALEAIMSECARNKGLRFRRSDMVVPEYIFTHIESGKVWREAESGTWSDAESCE